MDERGAGARQATESGPTAGEVTTDEGARRARGGAAPWQHTSRGLASGRRRRGRTLREVLGLVLVVLGGLSSIATNLADDEEPEQTDEQGLISCSEQAECAEHEATPHCLESYGLCVECLEDGHCGSEERCMEQRCAATCSSSASCEGELVCLDGLCRQCQTDADCGDPGQYCYAGETQTACRPLCTSSTECSGPGYVQGDVCRGGRCGAVACDAAQDCLLDREVCNPETGQCESIVR